MDNTPVPKTGVDVMNPGEMGTGDGWTIDWGVVWNGSTAILIIQNPPGAANWSIGTSGKELIAPMKIAGVQRRDLGPDLPQGSLKRPVSKFCRTAFTAPADGASWSHRPRSS